MEFVHIPVLLEQTVAGLNIKPGGTYLDGTCGGAGHSLEIARRLKSGRLICADRDPDAVAAASERLKDHNAKVIRSNYSDIKSFSAQLGITGYDGILLDLGVSSFQLDCPERGFSYHGDYPLDMRMSKEGVSAADIVNEYSEEKLADILYRCGEEKFSRRIAVNIVRYRQNQPIKTSSQLADIVRESYPAKFRRDKNPCKQTFQALRIEVNREFDHLEKGLDDAFDMLNKGGRMCVITFHSLEDRIVKHKFTGFCTGCICPPDFPKCVCGRTPAGKLVNRKPITADENELAANNRSRSAKLRIIEKL